MKTLQTTLSDSFQWIESLHFLLASKLITQHDFWLLTGNFVTLDEFPSVEEDLSLNVKADLETQRLLATNFMGIASSSKPAMVVGFTRIGVGAIWGEIKGDFGESDEMPLLKSEEVVSG